jgi:hypothetical protein
MEGLLRFIAHLNWAAILGYQKFGDESDFDSNCSRQERWRVPCLWSCAMYMG